MKDLFKNTKVGDIISETQYFKVVKKSGVNVIVQATNGGKIEISSTYLDTMNMGSADIVEKEEKVTATELAKILLDHKRTAMTVCYTKKPKQADLKKALYAIGESPNVSVKKVYEKQVRDALKAHFTGSERIIRGFHSGSWSDNNTRLLFTDMDVLTSPGPDAGLRQVDPETTQWIIVEGVKYSRK